MVYDKSSKMRNLKTCISTGIWFEEQVLWLAAQPRDLCGATSWFWWEVLLWKWLMVHKELQNLVVGHYPEKCEHCWYGKQCGDRGVLLLAWIPSVKVRGRHMFSAVRKSSFSSWVRNCLGRFLLFVQTLVLMLRKNWVGFLWIKIGFCNIETNLHNTGNSVMWKKWHFQTQA